MEERKKAFLLFSRYIEGNLSGMKLAGCINFGDIVCVILANSVQEAAEICGGRYERIFPEGDTVYFPRELFVLLSTTSEILVYKHGPINLIQSAQSFSVVRFFIRELPLSGDI